MKIVHLATCFTLSVLIMACEEEHHDTHELGAFEVTNPIIKDTIIFNNYVSQINAHQHIELMALEKGYLQEILIDEGQSVVKGQLLFRIQRTIYEAEVDIAKAEVETATIEYLNTKALADSDIVSKSELALAQAHLAKTKAELKLMQAHLDFTEIRAPFDGIIGRFEDIRLGSLLDEGELLTTLSDNRIMWVYFNVPEAVYLDYAEKVKSKEEQELQLQLANYKLFKNKGVVSAIESDFNNSTGTIPFRATFSNDDRLLRHGQTGNVLWPMELNDALIIPQKATFEVLDKKFVFVVDEEGGVHSREIFIRAELDHLYVVQKGLKLSERILIEGLRKVQDGDHIEVDYISPKEVYSHLKLHAE